LPINHAMPTHFARLSKPAARQPMHSSLRGAVLRHANLSQAILWKADPLDADLEGVNLKDAKVTRTQLTRAMSLKGAIMPDGGKHYQSTRAIGFYGANLAQPESPTGAILSGGTRYE